MASLDPLISAGLINTVLLGCTAAIAIRRDRRWAWLASLWALLLVVLAAILIQHRFEGRVETIAAGVEQIAWMSGPLLFNFMRAALGHRVTRRTAVPHFLLPATILLIGTPLVVTGAFEPLSPKLLVAYQLGYTLASVLLFVRRPEPCDRSLLGFWMPGAALAISAGIHCGQLIRFSPLGRAHSDAVPTAASAVVLLVLLVVAAVAHLLPARGAKYARSSLGPDEAQHLHRAARVLLERERLFLRPDLSLAVVAERLEVSVHRLSQALSEGGSISFNELLVSLRLDEAKRLLVEPGNAGVAIEPIGMEAGFRSRSAFYSSFRKRFGTTPAEYRATHSAFMSSPVGQDRMAKDVRISAA